MSDSAANVLEAFTGDKLRMIPNEIIEAYSAEYFQNLDVQSGKPSEAAEGMGYRPK